MSYFNVEAAGEWAEYSWEERAAIKPGSPFDRVVSLLEQLALLGWKDGTPNALTVTWEDGRQLTVVAGRDFLADAPAGRRVRT